jgi:hypothetical protein
MGDRTLPCPQVGEAHAKLTLKGGRARQPLTIPAQPDLSMKGRTAASLLRAVEEWHKKLGSEGRGMSVEWKPSRIRPFSCGVGNGPTRKVFAITELISSEELQEEGKAMGNPSTTKSSRSGKRLARSQQPM